MNYNASKGVHVILLENPSRDWGFAMAMPKPGRGDLLAASKDPKGQLAEMGIDALNATLTMELSHDIRRLAEAEFTGRLPLALSGELAGDWLVNSGRWARGKLYTEYLARPDARPEVVVRLYANEPDPELRREILRNLFKTKEVSWGGKAPANPIEGKLAAGHIEAMWDSEKDPTNQGWLAGCYPGRPGATFAALFVGYKRLARTGTYDKARSMHQTLLGMLPLASDQELLELLSCCLSDVSEAVLAAVARRTSIPVSQIIRKADELGQERTTRERFVDAVAQRYLRYPLFRLTDKLGSWRHGEPSSRGIKRDAANQALLRRLGEASTFELVQIASKGRGELRKRAIMVVATRADLPYVTLLAWGHEPQDCGDLNLIVELACQREEAKPAEIERLYPERDDRSALRAPSPAAFCAYAALPGSKKTKLLAWTKISHNLLDDKGVQRVLVRREDISAKEIARLLGRDPSDSRVRAVQTIYVQRPDREVKQLIKWIEQSRSSVAVLLSGLAGRDLSLEDVSKLLARSAEGSCLHDHDKVLSFLAEYLLGHQEMFEPLFERYPEGKANNFLAGTYKKTEAYRAEVQREAV